MKAMLILLVGVVTLCAETHPNGYWRRVNGTNYFLGPLVQWDAQPLGKPRPLPQWFLIRGQVTKHVPEGLMISANNGFVILQNFPMLISDDQPINAWAMHTRNMEYDFSALGVRTTRVVPVYDFGKIVAAPTNMVNIKTNGITSVK